MYIDELYVRGDKKLETALNFPFVCAESTELGMIPEGLQGVLGLGMVNTRSSSYQGFLGILSEQKQLPDIRTVMCRSELESMFYVQNPTIRIMVLKSISDVSRLNDTNQFGYQFATNSWPLAPSRINFGSSIIYQPTSEISLKVDLEPDSLDLDLPENLFSKVSTMIASTCSRPDNSFRCAVDPSNPACFCMPNENLQRFYSEIPSLHIHIQSDIMIVSSKHLLRPAPNSPNCLCLAIKSTKTASPSIPTTPNPPAPLPTTQQDTIKVGMSLLSEQSWVFASNPNTWTAVQAGCEHDVVSRDVIYVGSSEAWILWLAAVFVGLVLVGLITWVCFQAAGSVRRELPQVQVGRDADETDDEGAPDQSGLENVAINTSMGKANSEFERTTGFFSQISKSGVQVGSPSSKSPLASKRRIFVNKKSETELTNSAVFKRH